MTASSQTVSKNICQGRVRRKFGKKCKIQPWPLSHLMALMISFCRSSSSVGDIRLPACSFLVRGPWSLDAEPLRPKNCQKSKNPVCDPEASELELLFGVG